MINMYASKRRRSESLVTLIFVGGLFALVGLIFVGVSVASSRHAARVAGLPVLGAVELEDSAPGRVVLLEGRIDERARPRFRDLVAYIREEYRGNDSDGDPKWHEDERVTPRLLLDLPDGRVEIVNQDYQLEQLPTSWMEDNVLRWDERSDEGTKRYQGLQAGAQVLAIGTAAPGDEFPAISAELLAGGTREAYLAGQRTLQLVMGIVGGLFAALGLVLLVLGLRARWRMRRF